LVYRGASVIPDIALRAALGKQKPATAAPEAKRTAKAGITRELTETRAKKTLPLINHS
jgi:hypothetical protein